MHIYRHSQEFVLEEYSSYAYGGGTVDPPPLNGRYKPPKQGYGQKIKKFGAFFVKSVFLGIFGIRLEPPLPLPGYAYVVMYG